MDFCSPLSIAKKNKYCYCNASLIYLCNSWNELKPNDKIIFKNTDKSNILFNKLNEKFKKYLKKNNTYWAWVDILKYIAKKNNKYNIIKTLIKIENDDLRPSQPIEWVKNPVEWLSNFDIAKCLKQYEAAKRYKYKFLGVHSVDFALKRNNSCLYSNYCNINIKSIMDENPNIKYMGLVINLSKSSEPGTHWTSIFFVFDPTITSYGGYYYDSTTNGVPKDIKPFLLDIKQQAEKLFKKKFNITVNKIKHQFSTTECGLFSICFQSRWLSLLRTQRKLVTFHKIVKFDAFKDNSMKILRNKLFRPHIKSLMNQ